ncbi:hypothetical protein GCM10022224_098630 [Nonomuraea antimicrobica]|uniref:Uncharacterized protein n=1 Tax=Nonomuraea antimicrobica TaxID=561173 RepID=A0ABP7EDZ9_9ACTN
MTTKAQLRHLHRTAAIADRLNYNAIIETGPHSYRLARPTPTRPPNSLTADPPEPLYRAMACRSQILILLSRPALRATWRPLRMAV